MHLVNTETGGCMNIVSPAYEMSRKQLNSSRAALLTNCTSIYDWLSETTAIVDYGSFFANLLTKRSS